VPEATQSALPTERRGVPRPVMGLAAVACIAVQFPGSLWLSGLALALWLALLLVGDRPALARLWLPRFWLLTLAFALGSGLLLGPRVGHDLFGVMSREGLRAGLLMVVRGAFIFALASWASRTLTQEELQRSFRRVGLARLGSALGVALRLLPELQVRLRGPAAGGAERGLRRLREKLVGLVTESARLAETLATTAPRRSPMSRRVAAVTGAPRTGKTTMVGAIVEKLATRGLEAAGVVQLAQLDGGRTVGYELRAVPGGEKHALARRRAGVAPSGLGFDFDDEGWRWARHRIGEARRSRPLVVVDELGKLEAAGQGHLPALEDEIVGEPPGVFLVAVRAECAEAIGERLGGFALVLPTGSDDEAIEAFAADVQALAHSRRAQEAQG